MKLARRAYFGFSKIKLVDRCLILFMLVLLAQSVYSLTTGEGESVYTSNIDVVVRSTSAAIFGYFLSANFNRKTRNEKKDYMPRLDKPVVDIQPDKLMADVQLDKPMGDMPQDTPKADIPRETSRAVIPQETSRAEIAQDTPRAVIPQDMSRVDAQDHASFQQVVIATAIGLSSLLALLIARNFLTLTVSSVATASHLRDLVLGCVGFLVGCPVSEGDK